MISSHTTKDGLADGNNRESSRIYPCTSSIWTFSRHKF